MRVTAFVLLTGLIAIGCQKPSASTPAGGKDGPSGGTASIEGNYQIIEAELGGEKLPDDFLKQLFGDGSVTISADSIRFTNTRKKDKDEPMKYKLDPSKSPAEIDLTEIDFAGKSKAEYGIYKVEGDTLTIVSVASIGAKEATPQDRPKEFKTRPKTREQKMVLKKK